MVIVPTRGAPVALTSTANGTVPSPAPAVPGATRIHGAWLVADQGNPRQP